MTSHEFALSDLAARLAGTDASLSTALRDILSTALQELIEAELTGVIGVAPGEHSPDRLALRNGSAGVTQREGIPTRKGPRRTGGLHRLQGERTQGVSPPPLA
jgi:transposase-like protein